MANLFALFTRPTRTIVSYFVAEVVIPDLVIPENKKGIRYYPEAIYRLAYEPSLLRMKSLVILAYLGFKKYFLKVCHFYNFLQLHILMKM